MSWVESVPGGPLGVDGPAGPEAEQKLNTRAWLKKYIYRDKNSKIDKIKNNQNLNQESI